MARGDYTQESLRLGKKIQDYHYFITSFEKLLGIYGKEGNSAFV